MPNKVSRKKEVRPSSRASEKADLAYRILVLALAPWTTSMDPWSEQPHSGQFFAVSRVSLVCNVCSRLLPKEWFAERPMASARANSRVPPPRHLCIIMLSPRAPTLTRSLSLSSPVSSSPPLPSLREVCPLLPPYRCRPATSLPSALLVLPSAPTLSHFLSTLVSFRVGEKEKEKAKEMKHQMKEKERKKRNEEKRLGGALCQSG